MQLEHLMRSFLVLISAYEIFVSQIVFFSETWKSSPWSPRIAYLQDVPRTIMEADTLEKLLKVTPRDQWEDPPEEKNPTTKGKICDLRDLVSLLWRFSFETVLGCPGHLPLHLEDFCGGLWPWQGHQDGLLGDELVVLAVSDVYNYITYITIYVVTSQYTAYLAWSSYTYDAYDSWDDIGHDPHFDVFLQRSSRVFRKLTVL